MQHSIDSCFGWQNKKKDIEEIKSGVLAIIVSNSLYEVN